MRFSMLWLFLTLCLAGCESNHYEITLTPREDTLARELVCWRQSGQSQQAVKGFSERELRLLADAYQMAEPVSKGAQRFGFSGKFDGALPDDVGGAGRYLHWRTSLGSAAIYIERFRGQIDLAALVDQRRAAANLAADLLMEWFAEELRNEAAAEKLPVLDEELRRDVSNLVVYGLVAEAIPHPLTDAQAQIKDFAARYGQYLIERGYLDQQSLPKFFAALHAGDNEQLLALLRGVVSRKMELAPGEADRALKFLTCSESVQRSFEKFVQKSRTYQVIGKRMRDKYGDAFDAKSKPDDVLYYLATEAGFAILRADDALDVTLLCSTKPVDTNGQWDQSSGKITWKGSLAPRAAQVAGCVPIVYYAVWSTADAAAQQKLFGRVAFDGELLARYALWHAALEKDDALAWDAFLAQLSPDEKLLDRLSGFHFPSEQRDSPDASTKNLKRIEYLQQLLGEALAVRAAEAK